MKKNISKVTFIDYLITALKIWGAAWLGMLVCLIPVYIFRGISDSSEEIKALVQDIIIVTVGVAAASVILMLLVARSDESERWTQKEAWKISLGAVGIYCFAWMVCWIFFANNVYVSAAGLYFSNMIDQGEDGFPTFFGAFFGALNYGIFYAGAIFCGWRISSRRAQKRRSEIVSPTKEN